MRLFARLLQLPCSILLLFSSFGYASPPVQVSLDASFPSPPFLLELLETAADEIPASYFPLLDQIVKGKFEDAKTDKELYDQFTSVLWDDGHVTSDDTFASFQYALSIHSAAPRIEAHYQFYRSYVESQAGSGLDIAPDISLWQYEKKCWDIDCKVARNWVAKKGGDHTTNTMAFDRTWGELLLQIKKPTIIYADIGSPNFRTVYDKVTEQAADKRIPYRLRYKPPANWTSKPLTVNGYGVELALKKTDYIVIDDREGDGKSEKKEGTDKQTPEIKPVASSDIENIAVNAASFIMDSKDPFETLKKVAQDFPKHAAKLAARNASEGFLAEHKQNRMIMLPAGYNVLFMNGAQVHERDVDAFSLLSSMRRERHLIEYLTRLDLTAEDVINIMSHPKIGEAKANDVPQRFDWRDEGEGGQVILWLNDIEKDKRYEDWPTTLDGFMQRGFPGQMPSARKSAHTVIVPIDFSSRKDVLTVVEVLQTFIKRLIPVQFGLVPSCNSTNGKDHAKLVYHIHETYGLGTVIKYLESTVLDDKDVQEPNESLFKSAIEDKPLRKDREALAYTDILTAPAVEARLESAKQYLKRLGADGPEPPIIGNGVPMPSTEDWMQAMSQRLSMDVQLIQRAIYQKEVDQDTWLPSIFLKDAVRERNPVIYPEDDKKVKILDLGKLEYNHRNEFATYKQFVAPGGDEPLPGSNPLNRTHLFVILDFNFDHYFLVSAVEYAMKAEDVDIFFIHQHDPSQKQTASLTWAGWSELEKIIKWDTPGLNKTQKETFGKFISSKLIEQRPQYARPDAKDWSPVVEDIGFVPGDKGIVVNGRVVGPIQNTRYWRAADFESLVKYERMKRAEPVVEAMQDLGLTKRIRTGFALAKIFSTVALSTESDIPEGIFDNTSGPRLDLFEQWDDIYTCITKGDKKTATIQLVASIDPTSEIGQRWVSILTSISEMAGVHTRIFLNPKQKLEELPSKRFYRSVLNAVPGFDDSGARLLPSARFEGLPSDALFTMNMDTPASWLVAPKESIHDLDNIKLDTLAGSSSGISAVYELEHILIEGHTRDTTTGGPPRGAQLVLGTKKDPELAGTIVMANLGYFQFKANPGIYDLNLNQKGRTAAILKLDSAGTKGYEPAPGDNTTEISLMSFQGTTLYPRLSRLPGREDTPILKDVADETPARAEGEGSTAESLLAAASDPVDLLTRVGDAALAIPQRILSMTGLSRFIPTGKHADINIFSVASGHLYERMLNIMMVSVMEHTSHTVKFWFIEQFLSPSFKSFLPTLAAEYGFQYEYVTYAWPHWLRAQTEKQRKIWGYKILFLDVLFPLDLDKVIFVDADQIVRTDMYDLVQYPLDGAPYAFTPMCDSRTEMEGFRFWKQGYWANFLRGKPYHISALYVVDLRRFRAIAAGDRLRQQYHSLSADPNSLANLDQDLPNHMQAQIRIKSLPQEWLWCETWCSDESLKDARTIDLCNNPQTKEPKLDRARRQVPEWTTYDEEIAAVARRSKGKGAEGVQKAGEDEASGQKKAGDKSEL